MTHYDEKQQVWVHCEGAPIVYRIETDSFHCQLCGLRFSHNEGPSEPREMTDDEHMARAEPTEPPMASGRPVPKKRVGRPRKHVTG